MTPLNKIKNLSYGDYLPHKNCRIILQLTQSE